MRSRHSRLTICRWLAGHAGRALVLFAGMLLSVALVAQMPDHFEGSRWYDFREGVSLPKDVPGNLMVSARDEKLVFYWEHSKLIEVAFEDMGGVFYEFAPQPSQVKMPEKGWRRLRGKRPRHLLTIMVKEKLPTKPRAGEEGAQDALIFPVLFELQEAHVGRALLAIETATGRTVKRLESQPQ